MKIYIRRIIFIVQLLFVQLVINAQYVEIPDSAFEHRLISEGIDTEHNFDHQILMTDARRVGYLNASAAGIQSLSGIQYFTHLEELYCNENELTKLDLDSLRNLRILNCDDNQIDSLDLSNNSELEVLYCRNNMLEYLNLNNGNNTLETGAYVTHSIDGFVYEFNSQTPVANATVTINGNITRTNSQGFYQFHNISVSQEATGVIVRKEGFFKGVYGYIPTVGTQHRADISLLRKNEGFCTTINAANGGSVDVGRGQLIFPPNSVQTYDGTLYDGDMMVCARFDLDNAGNTVLNEPGDLPVPVAGGASCSNSSTGVVFSCDNGFIMSLDLRTSSGQELISNPDEEISLSIDVPPCGAGENPDVATMSFNELLGKWEVLDYQSGSAGPFVVPIGDPTQAVWQIGEFDKHCIGRLAGKVKDAHGNSLSALQVCLNDHSSCAYTNSFGSFTLPYPSSVPLTLSVRNSFYCYDQLYFDELGSFPPDDNLLLQDVVLDDSLNTIKIKGDVICETAPASQALIQVELHDEMYEDVYSVFNGFTDLNGQFSFNIIACEHQAEDYNITAIDPLSGRQSFPVQASLQSDSLVSIPAIDACERNRESYFLVFDLHDETIYLPIVSDEIPLGGGANYGPVTFGHEIAARAGSDEFSLISVMNASDFQTNTLVVSGISENGIFLTGNIRGITFSPDIVDNNYVPNATSRFNWSRFTIPQYDIEYCESGKSYPLDVKATFTIEATDINGNVHQFTNGKVSIIYDYSAYLHCY